MIEFRSVSFGYSGAESQVITRATFSVAAGEFALVCGPTGGGKSTLLKLINGLAPHFTGGNLSGQIVIDGRTVTGQKPHELAEFIGYVNQQPEGAFVADTVGEELAYGLEQLGFTPYEMDERITKFATLVGIETLIDQPLSALSGGQQQRVAIASAMAAGQRVLVLDEPTSALDAASAAELVGLLASLTKSEGITVLLAEHRLERVLEHIDSVIVVNGDGSVSKNEPRNAFNDYRLLPPVVELSRRLGFDRVALSIEEAKRQIKSTPQFTPLPEPNKGKRILRVHGLTVNYGRHEAVKGLKLEAFAGEVVAMMGPNGSGKSSALWAIQGSGPKSAGEIDRPTVTLVPQRAADLLFLNSLAEELAEADNFNDAPDGSTAKLFLRLSNRTDPKQHPRDLSAGQQLALVLAVQLVGGESLVLLDEPTRGLDYEAKRQLVSTIKLLQSSGRTILLASHDVEFVAQVANRVYVLDKGTLVAHGSTEELLGPAGQMPTQVAQILGRPGLLIAEQVIARESK